MKDGQRLEEKLSKVDQEREKDAWWWVHCWGLPVAQSLPLPTIQKQSNQKFELEKMKVAAELRKRAMTLS